MVRSSTPTGNAIGRKEIETHAENEKNDEQTRRTGKHRDNLITMYYEIKRSLEQLMVENSFKESRGCEDNGYWKILIVDEEI